MLVIRPIAEGVGVVGAPILGAVRRRLLGVAGVEMRAVLSWASFVDLIFFFVGADTAFLFFDLTASTVGSTGNGLDSIVSVFNDTRADRRRAILVSLERHAPAFVPTFRLRSVDNARMSHLGEDAIVDVLR